MASVRKQKNQVLKVQLPDGTWVLELSSLKDHVKSYFKNLFESCGNQDFSNLINNVSLLIYDHMNMQVIKEVFNDEIYLAVK